MPSEVTDNTSAIPELSEEFSLGDVRSGLEKIRTRLLDLTARNKLLNFRHPRASCLRFVDTSLDVLFQHLIDGNVVTIEVVPEPNREFKTLFEHSISAENDKKREIPAKDYAAHVGWDVEFDLNSTENFPRLRVLAYQDDLDRTAKKIATSARTSIEESGANMLYLCFNFLEWRDSDDDSPSCAPLLIMPVTLERENSPRNQGWVYRIQYLGEDLKTNLSLVEKMKRDFSVAIPDLGDEDTPSSYSKAIQYAISGRPDWKVRNFLTLALLSFGKLLMFLDLDPTRWPDKKRLTDHTVIKNLFEGTKSSSATFPDEYDLDEEDRKASVPRLFYDADSSQHSALIDALAGKNLVIEGPPGTGKSQTITNLIACALLAGKSILFVAEKMAALEVVYRRLNAIGLGIFCLELHSHKTQKREILNSLEQRLAARRRFPGAPNLAYKLSQAKETREQLNKYVRLLNTPHPKFGSTTFDIIWARHRAAMALPPNTPNLDSFVISENEQLTREAYERGNHATALFVVTTSELFQKWPILKEHPWRGVESSEIGFLEQSEILQLASSSNELAKNCTRSAMGLQQREILLPLTLGDLELCRSMLSSLPLTIPNSVFEVLPNLHLEESRRAILELCDHICKWNKTRVQIAQIADLDIATEIDDSVFTQLISLVEGRDIGEFNKAEILRLLEGIQTLMERVPFASALLTWGEAAFPWKFDNTPVGYNTVKQAANIVTAAPRDVLNYRHPGLLVENAPHVLRQAQEKSNDIRAKRNKLQQRFELEALPTSEALRFHASNLAESNAFSRLFRKDCRNANKVFRRLLKTAQKSSVSDIVSDLRELAEYQDRLAIFNADKRFNDVGGPFYESVDTQWSELLRVEDWLASAAQTTNQSDNELLRILVQMPTNDFRLLRQQIDEKHQEIEALTIICDLAKPTINGLPPSLRFEWHTSLNEFGGRLQEITLKLTSLSRLAAQSGLKNLLKLAHITKLYSLKVAERLQRAEFEQKNIELHLEDACSGPDTNVDEIKKAVDFAAQVDSIELPVSVRHWLLQDFETNSRFLRSELTQYSDHLAKLEQGILSMTRAGSLDSERFWSYKSIYEIPLTTISDRLEKAIKFSDDLPMYVDWLRAWDQCSAATSPGLPRLILDHSVEIEALPLIYEYIFYSSLAISCIRDHSDLMLFKGLAHESLRSRFASLDREILSLNAKYAASVIDTRDIPAGSQSGPVGQWTDLRLIDHELAKQKRHIPIRQLVNRAGRALKSLKPCFMMSPLSVAQYLEPGKLDFDLVVMDEASQLRPEDALGAIARGAQLVVVGDPKQLPPTSFFERVLEEAESGEDDLTAAEDAESILDVATSVYQPARRLRWHYRSKHHSLIEFSNHEFYKNLIVFPSAYSHHPDLGLKLIEVPNGKFVDRKNIAEAEQVVKAVLQHMQVHPNESLGVVALNFEQRELIDDLLDKKMMNDPYSEAYSSQWREKSEPLFIKNLENVQGDERDVIFISTTYGPNEQGKQFQRFGPINGPHGHRRLNVLFTRAKRRIEIFTSLQPANITTDGVSWGVKVLRQYLEFAKSGMIPEIPGADGDPDSDFEISVADILKSAGYDVVPQVGVAGFFIDIGVKDPADRGRFLAGIECDGAAYHSAKSARDRDRLRQEILESHGWKIYRIWSTDWFKNRSHESTRLLQFLSATKLQTPRS